MKSDDGKKGGNSRRRFVKRAAAGAAAVAGATMWGAGARAAVCDYTADLALVNGNILTMDPQNRVVSAVGIRDGRFVQVGQASGLGPCARTIDLRGATVIPGLIDSHVHFIRCGLNPGHEVRVIETATSIAELRTQILLRQRSLPAGEFITCIGGWNTNGLAERRLPTVAELDSAAPRNPVYLSTTGPGGAITNTLGMAFFASKGVTVNPSTGVLNAAQGLAALQSAQTDASRMTGTTEVMDFAVGLGMTMVTDMGTAGASVEGLPAHNYALDLWRQGKLKVRQRPFLNSSEDTGFTTAQMRVTNALRRMGDDVFRLNGAGERLTSNSTNPSYVDMCKFAAQNGWTVTQHSLTAAEIDFHISAYQQAATVGPIDKLRWSLAHLNPVTDAQIAAIKALGIGLNLQAWNYTSAAPAGPPWRKLVDSGIRLGAGSDATNVGAMNPWLLMYYMSTMKNNAGTLATPLNQQITRLEALRMYTIGSAYLSFDDDRLGSIEEGKLADLAVLSANPLTVSDDGLRKISSIATLQAGKFVWGRLG